VKKRFPPIAVSFIDLAAADRRFLGELHPEKVKRSSDRCDEFSNIHGLGQIRFPAGSISATFEEVRRVLERDSAVLGSALAATPTPNHATSRPMPLPTPRRTGRGPLGWPRCSCCGHVADTEIGSGMLSNRPPRGLTADYSPRSLVA